MLSGIVGQLTVCSCAFVKEMAEVNGTEMMELETEGAPFQRKKMKTSWMRPKEASMELDLNISALPFSEGKETYPDQEMKQGCSSGGNMVALVCVNCHLLVMMFKSSPLCPNCKYLHLLQSQDVSHRNLEAVKPLETLSLLR
ncbi:hypothetical protein ZIOFF_065930 [Zingiber officinale]|uniref:Uncharacterized protein n=1 Tax=Zingiber officinale TaxID=94328 RepID=A0A8J5K7B1_ZINOF|nr:hypothetical protein ZIOFF_065930 [Zingiber officinale]